MPRAKRSTGKTESSPNLSLLSAKAMGGIWARRGMTFQDLWLVHEAAGWATDALFRGFVNEGTEDVEAFWFADEKLKSFTSERWQMKDRLVDKELLGEVVNGFQKQHELSPRVRFHLAATGGDSDVWQIPEWIERVRRTGVIYERDSPEYESTFEDLRGKLLKRGIRVDAEFLVDWVDLDFKAGWALSDTYERSLRGLLLGLGVAQDRVADAANKVQLLVTARVGELVKRSDFLDSLAEFRAREPRPPAVSARVARAEPPPAAGRHSDCQFSFFPEGSVLLRFADGVCGLVDCGPDAARKIIPYLLGRSINALSFIAISHWHYQHYGGLLSVLNAMERVDEVWLSSDPGDPSSVQSRHLQKILGMGRRSPRTDIVDGLHERHRLGQLRLMTIPGVQKIYQAKGGAGGSADSVVGLAPSYDEYRLYGEGVATNNLSACYVVEIAGKQLLLGGHAQVDRWRFVLDQAKGSEIRIQADAFLLPHFGSHTSLSPRILEAVVNPDGFVAILPTSPIFKRPRYKIPDDDVLAAVREAKGNLVICGNDPIHFVLNGEGLYQSLAPGPR